MGIMKSFYISSFLLILSFSYISAQTPKINELMSSNYSTIVDENGETYDWIEIFNTADVVYNLEGNYLSDDINELEKWKFPSIELGPKEYLVVFCSGNSNNSHVSSWQTVVQEGNSWRYFVGKSEPPSDWKTINFNDNNWNTGLSGFGYGDDDDATIIEPTISVFLRRTFSIDDTSDVSRLLFAIDYDDGFAAYINGVEIARSNLDYVGGKIQYNQFATTAQEAKLYRDEYPETISIENPNTFLVNGNNVLSVQVHNISESSSDLTANPFLVIGYKSKISEPESIPDFMKQPSSGLHANFKLSSTGETVYLNSPALSIIDSVKFMEMESDISFGRQPDGSGNFYFFSESTPGSQNNTEIFISLTDSPEFSTTSSFNNTPFSLEITNKDPDAQNYYTLDGSEPDEYSEIYTTPIFIDKNTVVRAKSFKSNSLPSSAITKTYFFNIEKTLPIISLSMNPIDLWDEDTGIYVKGKNAEPNLPYYGANFWQDWEKVGNIEFFEGNSISTINDKIGVKIFGGWSRAHAQKSLSIHARSVYGNKNLDYQIFPDMDINKFESLVLRNAGNDWEFTLIRDGMMQSLVDDMNIDRLAFRPAILYLNGEYWGIHNIREKGNNEFIASHHNIDKNSIDLLEKDGTEINGDNQHYSDLKTFLNSNNLSDDSNYEIVKSYIDIDNFLNYNLVEIYVANADWPGNNIKFWRSDEKDGKLRWILYDMDFGFGYRYGKDYTHNTLRFALATNGPDWPNPPWSTLILRKLLENDNFRNKFINRFCDLTNSIFELNSIKDRISRFRNMIELEVPSHSERWGKFSFGGWRDNINELNDFAEFRLSYLKTYFANQFNLDDQQLVELNISGIGAGKIILNSLNINEFPWEGAYYQNMDISLTAVPNPGYNFIGWSGSIQSSDSEIYLTVGSSNSITALFEKNEKFSPIVINEINYNSSPEFDTKDWIELHNFSDNSIDVSNWILKDSNDDNPFIFPNNTVINPNGYLIICRDSTQFNTFFPKTTNSLGNLNFALDNSGELLRLFNSSNEIIDSVRFDDLFPWPAEPDGNGYTLELTNALFDNSTANNWGVSSSFGTPGEKNNSYLVDINHEILIIPEAYELKQNYPNPFNPSTKIEFSIPNNSEVVLYVSNILGERVDVLVDEYLKAGQYNIRFDRANLSSGVYFYTLSANNFNQTKKMLFLK